MKLYIENEQSLIYSRSNSPQFNSRDDWYYQKAIVDEKEIKFYFSYKYQSSAKDIMNSLFNSRGYYLYFQLESQWYKMDAYQEILYLGCKYFDVTDYIKQNGTFTTERLNRRLDGVELFDIAQVELISENLECVM